MKRKGFLFAILLFAMGFSFSNTAKPGFPLQSTDYLSLSIDAFNKKDCRKAKLNYKLYKVYMKPVSEHPIYARINKCLESAGQIADALDASNEEDLTPFEANLQPKNTSDVTFGNRAFRSKDPIKAAAYFLRYLTVNEYLFNNDPEKKEDFMKKIEYCLSGID